jgi:hypothetical protein
MKIIVGIFRNLAETQTLFLLNTCLQYYYNTFLLGKGRQSAVKTYNIPFVLFYKNYTNVASLHKNSLCCILVQIWF